MGILPEKTIERLSQYRRALIRIFSNEKQNIFSHELASLLHLTPVQVRRDLMLIGY
ncbi:MAG TPA: winged-helix domain-containing protein [Bacteroidales bacterium]|nr:winged-helix domain-containing protein [Bacteroidales bacterium]HPS16875.1 winged-helix domain-containing protein [Bacteroidales bacterium]